MVVYPERMRRNMELTRDEIRSVVNPELQLRNVDAIFTRVFEP
jgi:hypothetical protein